ncbi:prolyl endopeptidase FAP-like [Pollicipes pollicipes]|uniref:prolyl endopeptidase FAP-like n=1 Tax=Pollicipes pollicipes TaxID=41117 RepID=UPI001884A5FA|nr:prolyl endopeptidase FAP-like [Pollicipes pollicipes]
MVHRGNVYYKERAISADSYSVTSDGVPSLVYHGVPDLLYADYILRSDHTVWPSPSGSLLLYFTINCTAVMDLQYTEYGTGADPSYPRVHSVKYPRAGATNPSLTVTVVNVSEPQELVYHAVQPPTPLADRELYAAGVRWLDDSQVSVTWYGRRQNFSSVSVCTAPSWRCQTVYRSESAHGWVEVTDGPIFSADKKSALLLDRVRTGRTALHTDLMVDALRKVVTQLTSTLDFVTPLRVIAVGHGYGAYLVLTLLAKNGEAAEVCGVPGRGAIS